MADILFSFSTDSYQSQFTLVNYSGREELSKLFKFDLMLKVKLEDVADIDFIGILTENASLNIAGPVGEEEIDYRVTGMLESIEEEYHGSATHKYYRASLVPTISRQTRNLSYDIYVGMKANEILEEELSKDLQVDYGMSLTADYPQKAFVCQYAESNFSFISRLASHWGIYYYFDHTQNGKMVFADDEHCEPGLIAEAKLDLSNNKNTSFNTVRTLRKSFHAVPAGVIVSEINPEQASLHFEGTAGEVDEKNCVHLVSEGCDDKDEADTIAKIRLDEYQCQSVKYHGTSGIPCLAPGFSLLVSTPDGGQEEILITSVQHQASNLDNSHRADDGEGGNYYEATFTAIPKEIVFRPKYERDNKPRAISTTARVYSAEENSGIAQRDASGHYQVIFDFLKGEDPKVSCWMRRASHTAHTNHFDMPLTPGTEVQIAFVDGNPDRPYIESALENSQSLRYPVNNERPHHASIRTDGTLYMEALKSKQALYISAVIDPDEAKSYSSQHMIPRLNPDGTLNVENSNYVPGYDHIYERYGDEYTRVLGTNFKYGRNADFNFGAKFEENHVVADQNPWHVKQSYDLSGKILDDEKKVTHGIFDDGLKDERKAGIVRKDFGNTYYYQTGTHSTWAQGAEQSGIHSTFNYGGRYVENNASLDASKNGKKGTSLPSQWPDESLVTQNFGDTYQYIEGVHSEGHDGDYTFQRKGNTTETYDGAIEKSITGNVKTEIKGDLETTVTGSKETVKKTLGDYSETVNLTGNYTENITTAGENNTISLATSTKKTRIGQISDVNTDPDSKTEVGTVVETFIGIKMSNSLALTSDIKGGASITVDNVSKLWEGKIAIENGKVKLEKATSSTTTYNFYSVTSTVIMLG